MTHCRAFHEHLSAFFLRGVFPEKHSVIAAVAVLAGPGDTLFRQRPWHDSAHESAQDATSRSLGYSAAVGGSGSNLRGRRQSICRAWLQTATGKAAECTAKATKCAARPCRSQRPQRNTPLAVSAAKCRSPSAASSGVGLRRVSLSPGSGLTVAARQPHEESDC